MSCSTKVVDIEQHSVKLWHDCMVPEVSRSSTGSLVCLNGTESQVPLACMQHLAYWVDIHRSGDPGLFADRCSQLATLVRGGCPPALRGSIWKVFLEVGSPAVPGHYQDLVQLYQVPRSDTPADTAPWSKSRQATSSLTKPQVCIERTWIADQMQDARNQIDKDIPRTFPGNPEMEGPGAEALQRVLYAYANYNPALGYCQGMNFIAGMLLLHVPEETAFWGLVRFVSALLPGYFERDMRGALLDQQATMSLLQRHLPTVFEHCMRLQLDVSLIASQWLLSAFVAVLPFTAAQRLWDVLLFEMDSSTLFKAMLAMLDKHAQKLLQCDESSVLWKTIASTPTRLEDIDDMINTACFQYSGITREVLNTLRGTCCVQPTSLSQADNQEAQARLSSKSLAIGKFARHRSAGAKCDLGSSRHFSTEEWKRTQRTVCLPTQTVAGFYTPLKLVYKLEPAKSSYGNQLVKHLHCKERDILMHRQLASELAANCQALQQDACDLQRGAEQIAAGTHAIQRSCWESARQAAQLDIDLRVAQAGLEACRARLCSTQRSLQDEEACSLELDQMIGVLTKPVTLN